jgi:ADP-ribose pyrophosphatase YjhB (NUDIX family)
VAAVFVFHPDGRLYLQRHKKREGRLDHTVGGHVLAGESYAAAAYREMHEEVGLFAPLMYHAHGLLQDGVTHGTSHRVHLIGLYSTTAPAGWTCTPTAEVDQLDLMDIGSIADLLQQDPDRFTHGFAVTFPYMRQLLAASRAA